MVCMSSAVIMKVPGGRVSCVVGGGGVGAGDGVGAAKAGALDWEVPLVVGDGRGADRGGRMA